MSLGLLIQLLSPVCSAGDYIVNACSINCGECSSVLLLARAEGGDNLLNNAFGYGVHIGGDRVRGRRRQWTKAYCPLEMIYCGKALK